MASNPDKLLELEAALASALHVNRILNQEIEKYVKSLHQAEEETHAWKAREKFLASKVLELRKQRWSDACGESWDEAEQMRRILDEETREGEALGQESVRVFNDYAARRAEEAKDVAARQDHNREKMPEKDSMLEDEDQETAKQPPPLPLLTSSQESHLAALVTRGREAGWLVRHEEVELGPLLGRGSFGATYRGRWRGAAVAVKCVRVSSAREFTSFLREVESLALVRHPNVVPFLGACLQPPDRFWLLSEYLPGGTLADWLHPASGAAARPPLVKRIEMAFEVAQGMLALHSSSPPILHRDLKPSNIYLDSGGRPRIGDFGLSRRLFAEARATLTGETGTYYYMAPEVIRHEVYDQRVDVWSWGVLLCECASGQPPYADAFLTPVQLALAVSTEEMRPTIPTHVDVHVEVVARMALDWDPYARPDFDLIVQEMQQAMSNLQKKRGGSSMMSASGGSDSLLWRLQRTLTSSWGTSFMSRIYGSYPQGTAPPLLATAAVALENTPSVMDEAGGEEGKGGSGNASASSPSLPKEGLPNEGSAGSGSLPGAPCPAGGAGEGAGPEERLEDKSGGAARSTSGTELIPDKQATNGGGR